MSLLSKIAKYIPEQFVHLIWKILRHFPNLMMKVFGKYFGLIDTSEEQSTSIAPQSNGPVKVLLLHGLEPASRQTTVDYVSAFMNSKYSVQLTVANIFGFMPDSLSKMQFDLAVVTTEALSHRTTPFWKSLESRIATAMKSSLRKVIMPQDDYTDSRKLDKLVVKAGIDTIYSPLIKGLDLIYPKSSARGVSFVEALTGYFDASKMNTRKELAFPFRERPIDVGQRVRKLPPQFGEIGIRKFEIADVLSKEAKSRGQIVDFSSDPNDVMLGEEWFEFLGKTKFTVSCRGGSSIVDPKGIIASRLSNLHKYFPKMGEEKAFRVASWPKHITGDFDAVSPRLFDAAMMGVCQVLLEDEYMGMQPWEHYIPLKRDYSNIDEVFEAMAIPGLAEKIVINSQNFLLDSTKFSYESLVESMLEKEVGHSQLTSGKSTLVDVDAIVSCSTSKFDIDEFSEMVALGRSKVNSRNRMSNFVSFSTNNLQSNFQDQNEIVQKTITLDRWLSAYYRKPAFPEILIVRWCPLSWFLISDDFDSKEQK